jgi:predicted DNA-binding protein
MSVLDMKREIIEYIQKVEDEKFIENILKRIRAYDPNFNTSIKAEDVFTKAQIRYDQVLEKLAQ